MVKFAMEFWWKMLLTIFPQKEARKSPSKLRLKFATSFAKKLRQLHSGNRWRLKVWFGEEKLKACVRMVGPKALAQLLATNCCRASIGDCWSWRN